MRELIVTDAMKHCSLALGLMVAYCAVVAGTRSDASTQVKHGRSVDLTWFFDALRAADETIVLEGLPHPMDETSSFRREKSDGDQLIGKERFYAEPLRVSSQLTAELTNAFLKESLFEVPLYGQERGISLCCFFHADYACVWKRGGTQTAAALVCFGCNEVKLVGAQVVVHTDLTPAGITRLRALLSKLRHRRPPYQRDDNTIRKPTLESPPDTHVPVDLPNDVAEKAVKELSRQPVSETEFWWLENLLRESTRKKR